MEAVPDVLRYSDDELLRVVEDAAERVVDEDPLRTEEVLPRPFLISVEEEPRPASEEPPLRPPVMVSPRGI